MNFYLKASYGNPDVRCQTHQPDAAGPPPDLAIETDVTSKTTVDADETIEIPELWIYASSGLKIYLLQDGHYIQSETSPTFPNSSVTELISQTIDSGTWGVFRL